jgi:hypothetical protein
VSKIAVLRALPPYRPAAPAPAYVEAGAIKQDLRRLVADLKRVADKLDRAYATAFTTTAAHEQTSALASEAQALALAVRIGRLAR